MTRKPDDPSSRPSPVQHPSSDLGGGGLRAGRSAPVEESRASTPSPSAGLGRTTWLIESEDRFGRSQFFSLGDPEWTPDTGDALQFGRDRDAHEFANKYLDGSECAPCHIVGYTFSTAALAQPAPSASTPSPSAGLRRIEDAMADLVDLLAADPGADIDPRAWRQLLIYAPAALAQPAPSEEQIARARKAYWDARGNNTCVDDAIVHALKAASAPAQASGSRLNAFGKSAEWNEGYRAGWDARILAQGEPAPAQASEPPPEVQAYELGRNRAIEAAAKVAENPGFIQAQDTEWDEGVNYAKRFIANAIRALAQGEPQK